MVIYAPNSYTYYYQFFITHSLFHSRLKTFLMQILPTAAFLFLLQNLLSAGLMPTEARGDYLPEAPYLRVTNTYLNCI